MPGHLPAVPDPAPAVGVDLPLAPAATRRLEDRPPPGAGGLNPMRLLAAVVRHRWLLLGCGVLGVGAGFLASRYVAPQYVAQATVWIEGTSREQFNQGPIRSARLLESYAWVELLKSYTVLDHVVQQQRLYVGSAPADSALFAGFGLAERFRPGAYRLAVTPDGRGWTLATGDGMEVERGRVGDAVGRAAGFAWQPPRGELRPARVVEFSVQNPRDVARGLAAQIETRMAEDGNFLSLSLGGDDPVRLATTLNAVTVRYVEVAAQLKRAKLEELTAILEEQRDYAERNLRDSEIALEGFRVQTVTLPSQQSTPVAPGIEMTRDPVFGNFFDMKVAREELRRDRAAVERVLTGAGSGALSLDALSVIPAVQQNPDLSALLAERTTKRAELRALLARYTDEHPPVRRLREELGALEGSTIPGTARQLVAQLAGREGEMEGRIASASDELRQIPPRAIEETRLERRVAIANTLYGTLRQRYEEARLAAVSALPDVRVLDEAAVPYQPVQDRRSMVVGGVAGLFLALGLAVVFVRDRMDRRVRFPEQVTGEMGLPILGAVPHVKALGTARALRMLGPVEEAFRELRLALVHAHGAAGPLLLTVTSPESGDGKSTVAASLALAFAEQGHRTVLVDGDIRRGVQHRTLGAQRSPGLTDYLCGRADLAAVLQSDADRPFVLVGSGTRMQAGPELLGSAAMGQLLAELRTRFSVVIVDSPPLGAGVDAYVLGTATRNLVLVLRTGSTDGELAEAKLALLDRLPVRVLGAVLNAVPASRAYRVYSYLPGYAAEDEEPAARLVGSAGGPGTGTG